MSRLNSAWMILFYAFTLTLFGTGASAQTNDTNACDQAAKDAETEFALPAGMLAAIGAVESARWPWTANIDGAAETYKSKAEAVLALTRVRSPTPSDVDVGCFQISLHHHPAAFATMAEALDPAANARYAAHFLRELHDRYGDWDRAVGTYHSATGALEANYRGRVLAHWSGPPAPEQPRWRVISIATSLQPDTRALPRIITLGD
jgi:hypothetical protein